MNYYDILLAKKLEDDRDPQVVGLSVTENGTYSEEGKVYKPVVVNVPLPSDAYLLKSIEHEQVASFTDGTDNFLKSLEVAIEPVQSGGGDPSPTNIRPISGWDECKVTVADDLENPTVSNVYTIDLNGTRYGGKLDVINGVLTVDGILETIDPSKFEGTSGGGLGWIDFNDSYVESLQNNNVMCSKLSDMVDSGTGWTSNTPCIAFRADPHVFRLYGNSALFSSGGAYENTTIYYKLKTPIEIQLTPTIIKSLQGDNNLFASTGEIELLQYFGKETA